MIPNLAWTVLFLGPVAYRFAQNEVWMPDEDPGSTW
jgi:hypothetical protein